MMYLVRVDKQSDKRYEVLYYEEYHGSYDKDDGFLKLFGYTPVSYGDDLFLVDLDFISQTEESDMITNEKRILDVRKQMRRLININKLI